MVSHIKVEPQTGSTDQYAGLYIKWKGVKKQANNTELNRFQIKLPNSSTAVLVTIPSIDSKSNLPLKFRVQIPQGHIFYEKETEKLILPTDTITKIALKAVTFTQKPNTNSIRTVDHPVKMKDMPTIENGKDYSLNLTSILDGQNNHSFTAEIRYADTEEEQLYWDKFIKETVPLLSTICFNTVGPLVFALTPRGVQDFSIAPDYSENVDYFGEAVVPLVKQLNPSVIADMYRKIGEIASQKKDDAPPEHNEALDKQITSLTYNTLGLERLKALQIAFLKNIVKGSENNPNVAAAIENAASIMTENLI